MRRKIQPAGYLRRSGYR